MKLINQVKDAIQNKDQIKEQVVQNLQVAGKIVEIQAKHFIKQTKNSKFYNEKFVPFAQSELADKALDTIGTKLKLKDTVLMKQIQKFRSDLTETKVKEAKVAKKVTETAETTEEA